MPWRQDRTCRQTEKASLSLRVSERLNESGIGLGDDVRSRRHGYRGRVTQVHLLGWPESQSWFDEQSPPFDPARYDVGVWLEVLLEIGGAVLLPAVDAELVPALDLNNALELDYWPQM